MLYNAPSPKCFSAMSWMRSFDQDDRLQAVLGPKVVSKHLSSALPLHPFLKPPARTTVLGAELRALLGRRVIENPVTMRVLVDHRSGKKQECFNGWLSIVTEEWKKFVEGQKRKIKWVNSMGWCGGTQTINRVTRSRTRSRLFVCLLYLRFYYKHTKLLLHQPLNSISPSLTRPYSVYQFH